MRDEPTPPGTHPADDPVPTGRSAQLAEPWNLAERCNLECGRTDVPSLALLVVEIGSAKREQAVDWLSQGLRRDDLVAHLGGGRYAILLPGAGAYDAGRVAARIRQHVPGVDIGIGVHPQDGSNLSELVVAALREMPGPFQMSA